MTRNIITISVIVLFVGLLIYVLMTVSKMKYFTILSTDGGVIKIKFRNGTFTIPKSSVEGGKTFDIGVSGNTFAKPARITASLSGNAVNIKQMVKDNVIQSETVQFT